MAIFKKESLEQLRQRVDLVEVLNPYVDLKPAGASYKALCPFHDEKSPSFVVQRGDSHYHCFGCGAHGDAIAFLMEHQKLNFTESVEHLADRFQVTLETVEKAEDDGPKKRRMREAMEHACSFYHFFLLHTEEGKEALQYLYERGLGLEFIHRFRIGLAPSSYGMFQAWMKEKLVSEEILIATGLAKQKPGTHSLRDFFYERILFPIHHPSGFVIGFSGRKYKEKTFGGKYVNTPETLLFKKSRVLFGFNECRRQIAKERQAIIVEGQIDALRLIDEGFEIVVAGQGTAFGEGHVQELTRLGVHRVYLALDGDAAGKEASIKIGNLFQKVGVEAMVVPIPLGFDPDTILIREGPDAFREYLEKSQDYLSFLVEQKSKRLDLQSPAAKKELVYSVAAQIRSWEEGVMVHESLKKLSRLTQVPEEMIGVGQQHLPNLYIQKSENAGLFAVNSNQVLELDLLRWLLTPNTNYARFLQIVRGNLSSDYFHDEQSKKLYEILLEKGESTKPPDFISLAIELGEEHAQDYLTKLMEKKIDRERAEEYFLQTVQKMLEKKWMEEREAVSQKLKSGENSDEEEFALLKEFKELKKEHPQVWVPKEETDETSRVL